MTKEIIRYVEQKEKETGIIVSHIRFENEFKSKDQVDDCFCSFSAIFKYKYPNCEQLKQFSTMELVSELITRQGVEHGAAGLYKPYEIRRKFVEGPLREPIQADQVIIIRSFEDIRSS